MSRSSSSALNKKLDEKNLKTLRDLVALPINKQCFDCQQRGPTYVNTTIGSFVCTSCSGRLRGLNPPHRLKSISMATFSNEELELMKSRGNEYCRKVWMGKYDKSRATIDESSFKDEIQMRDFLALKYDKKRWYVNPSEIQFANATPNAASDGYANFETPEHNSHSPVPAAQHDFASTNNHTNGNGHVQTSTLVNTLCTPVRSAQSVSPRQNAEKPRPHAAVTDLFGSPIVHSNQAPNFANFDAFATTNGGDGSSSMRPTPAFEVFGCTTLPKSVTLPTMPSKPTAAPLQQKVSSGGGGGGGDKYSALKELDELFSTSNSNVAAAVPPPAPTTNQQWAAVSSTSQALNTPANIAPVANPFFGSSPNSNNAFGTGNFIGTTPNPFGSPVANNFTAPQATTYNPFATGGGGVTSSGGFTMQQHPASQFAWGAAGGGAPAPPNPFASPQLNAQFGSTTASKTWNPFTN